MIFICNNCNQRMKSDDVTGAGNGTLSVASFCPKCGGRFILWSNPGETLLLKSLNAGAAGQQLMGSVMELAGDTLPSAVDQCPPDSPAPGADWRQIKDEWVWIEPGEFVMGSPDAESGRETDEPLHQIELSNGFFLGKYVIPRGHWQEVMGTDPWKGDGEISESETLPAVSISWDDVQSFIQRLNDSDSEFVYRLPTEAEWEYACRAGTRSMWSFGEDRHVLGDYAWYMESEETAGNQSACEVGTRLANPWGLHDMHGNVWEWCQDVYDHDYYLNSPSVDPKGPEGLNGVARVARGGYYRYFTRHSRSAARNARYPNERHRAVGARLVREAR